MKTGNAPVAVKSYASTTSLTLEYNPHRRYLAIAPDTSLDVVIGGNTITLTEFTQFEVAPVNEIEITGSGVILEG